MKKAKPNDAVEYDGVTLDIERALADVGQNFELLQELGVFFLEDAPTLLDTLQSAIERKDSKLAERQAHSLKSMVATFGAEPTSSLARKAEMLAKMHGWDELHAILPTLRASICQTMEALKEQNLAPRDI